jgi:IS6 family transposase
VHFRADGPSVLAWCTLVGYEALAMMRKGQVKGVGGDDIVAQAAFVNSLFGIAA